MHYTRIAQCNTAVLRMRGNSPITDKEGVGVGFGYVGRGMIITNYDAVIE